MTRLVRRRLAGLCPVSRFCPVLRLPLRLWARAEADSLPGCADPLGCHQRVRPVVSDDGSPGQALTLGATQPAPFHHLLGVHVISGEVRVAGKAAARARRWYGAPGIVATSTTVKSLHNNSSSTRVHPHII